VGRTGERWWIVVGGVMSRPSPEALALKAKSRDWHDKATEASKSGRAIYETTCADLAWHFMNLYAMKLEEMLEAPTEGQASGRVPGGQAEQ
jgi:hypothetical protein